MNGETPTGSVSSSRIDSGVLRRILHGFGANAYSQIVTIVIQLAGVPILLHAWGEQLYGEWLILAAIPTYLSMADLGFSQSAGNDMTARMGRGDTQGALAVFQSLAALVYGLAVAGLALVILLVALLPLGHWLHLTSLSTSEVRWILWLLVAQVLVKLADGVNHAGFRANGDYALHVQINANTLLVQQVGMWGLALSGCGLLVAAAWFVGVWLVATPAVALLLFRRHPVLRPGFVNARLAHLQGLLRPALANLSLTLANALSIQGMLLVVAAVMGPVAVVTYSVLRTLTRLVVQGIAAITHAMEPEVARAWGQGNSNLVRILYLRGMGISLALALGVGIALYFLGGLVVAFWTHGKVVMNAGLFHWLLLAAFTTVLWQSAVSFLKALNRQVRVAMWFVIASGAGLLLAYLLLRWTHDLAGVGMALVAVDIGVGVYALLLANRLSGLHRSYAS
ncbi:hypothetical protein MQE22_01370 [Acidithiobacillus sp. YTS05]|uniref:Polysaccharide biosynthesis protein n=1 Tax=Igneacidithiobacillus copahuensis TaxID=2724909 RepID=A0AAE2YPT7_9PROT|nr:hypothetical protein [Igneacidithiobacillus copahuensis]MBU2788020.1 hypothetical protein [Igneacidithiobacillus copahuensis]MBU2796614.1 hypothetical protein [Acidithiobacillus sp. VAN18-2]UTV81292.1 hypothetical protein MQE22_01370 [Acidithiobacillus sp. YTS05]